jgi:exodeoxyribonuclease-3
LKIASWNVNSLRVRLEQVTQWLQVTQPDVLALQETKLPDDAFPIDVFESLGYEVLFSGQKTYNGVAIISRLSGTDVIRDLTGMQDDARRVLGATFGDTRVLNLYVPNGQRVGSDKYAYKLRWLEALQNQLAEELQHHENIVLLGDFNVAPEDRDVYDPSAWAGQVLVSEPERQALQSLLDQGLADTFRLFEQPPDTFSWWDYRLAGFRRNRGLRIDLILASPALAERCVASGIDPEPRALERPSDHAPALATFQ